jgi:enamine deaminase RidA (YjgF/YER057c/UK114 family)
MGRRQLAVAEPNGRGASPAVGIDPAAGELVFVSGQIARTAAGEIIGRDDPTAQARACFAQIAELLAVAGGRLQDIARLVYYLTHIDEDLPIVCAVRDSYDWSVPPASTAVQVSRLAHRDLRVEIEATAIIRRPVSPSWAARLRPG